ncbi:MAG: hypothetical protein KDE29_16220, partial [Anaerolineales bacterium]|nr:hypothetical protein [Anaerolineales bacterium]
MITCGDYGSCLSNTNFEATTTCSVTFYFEAIRRLLAATGRKRALAAALLWDKVGLALYGRPWSRLTPAEQAHLRAQVDAIAVPAGWAREAGRDGDQYIRPLPVDAAAARRRLQQFLARQNGRPVAADNLIYQAQLGAYGRGFYSDELAPALQAILAETLQTHGYHPTP